MSHLDKCCRWCEREFGSKRTRYRHENENHSEEVAASRLKHSIPDEDTYFKCVHCNSWSLNTSQSIENHEKSAWHKSRNIRLQKKRKPDSSSSRLPERPSYRMVDPSLFEGGSALTLQILRNEGSPLAETMLHEENSSALAAAVAEGEGRGGVETAAFGK